MTHQDTSDQQNQDEIQNFRIQQKFQNLMTSCIQAHLYEAAVFFGDKLLSVGGATLENLQNFVQALYYSRQYRRALHIIQRENLAEKDLQFRYLAGRCLYNCKEWDECLYLLGDDESQYNSNTQEMDFAQADEPEFDGVQGQQLNHSSCISFLKGQVYDTLENKNRAKFCYQQALQLDPYNYEAFQHLIDNHMMTADEEDFMVQKLNFKEEDHWLRLFYMSKCKKYLTSSQLIKIVSELEGFDNVDDYQPVINNESLYVPLQPYNKMDPKDEMLQRSISKSSQIDERDSFGDMEQDMEGFSFDKYQPQPTNPPNTMVPSNQNNPLQYPRVSSTHQNVLDEMQRSRNSASRNHNVTKGPKQTQQQKEQSFRQSQAQYFTQLKKQVLQDNSMDQSQRDNDENFNTQPMQADVNSHPIKADSFRYPEEQDDQTPYRIVLKNNLDIRLRLADWYIQMGNYLTAYRITSQIIEYDPYFLDCFVLHFASSVELQKKNDLFLIAHRLVDEHPNKAVSWYAVGCYYTIIKQWPNARRYFGKATSLQSTFAPAWIALGNSFAAEDESDQAMVAYRTAARLFPGLAAPMLGISLEYLRMSNLELAEQMLLHAKEVLGPDPSLYNQLGVLAYQRKDYQDAAGYFCVAKQRAIDLKNTESGIEPAFEPIVVNFGQSLRKLKHYDMSIREFELALSLNPNVPSTHSSLALCYHIIGKLEDAIAHYHFALSVRSDDPLTTDLLTKALQEQSQLFIKTLQFEEEQSVMIE